MYEKRKKPLSLVFSSLQELHQSKPPCPFFNFSPGRNRQLCFSVFVHIFRQLKITEFCFPIF